MHLFIRKSLFRCPKNKIMPIILIMALFNILLFWLDDLQTPYVENSGQLEQLRKVQTIASKQSQWLSLQEPWEDLELTVSEIASTPQTSGNHEVEDDERTRCAEVRRLVREGVVDYVKRDGDTELLTLIQPMFNTQKLVVYSVDHHIGPVFDIRSLLEPLGVEFITHTLYPKCDFMCTCGEWANASVFTLSSIVYPKLETLDAFVNDSRTNPEIVRADAFLVTYAIELIVSYTKFTPIRSVILAPAMRFDRHLFEELPRLRRIINTIIELAKLKTRYGHVVAADNQYDRMYMRYFTGTEPDYVPNFCAYTGQRYNPTIPVFLFARKSIRTRRIANVWIRSFRHQYLKIDATFKLIDILSSVDNTTVKSNSHKFDFKSQAAHLGVVHVPYDVSVMSFFEQYTMGIPLFAPSLEFLVRMHMDHWQTDQRTFNHGYRWTHSFLPAHPSLASANHSGRPVPDPNDDVHEEPVRYWLALADYYYFPHVTLFESVEQLVDTLQRLHSEASATPAYPTLRSISSRMMHFNRQRLKQLLRYWRARLYDIARLTPNNPPPS